MIGASSSGQINLAIAIRSVPDFLQHRLDVSRIGDLRPQIIAMMRNVIAATITPPLDSTRFACTWPKREAGIIAAVRVLSGRRNALGLTHPVDPTRAGLGANRSR